MIIVHGPHLKMQHKVNFLSKCISLFFPNTAVVSFFHLIKALSRSLFWSRNYFKAFYTKRWKYTKKITKQKIESKYFMCDASPFFFSQ